MLSFSQFFKLLCELFYTWNFLDSLWLQVPELTSAAGYFFRAGAEGKRTCPTVRPDFGVLLLNVLPLYYGHGILFSSSSKLYYSFLFVIVSSWSLMFQVLLLMASAISTDMSDPIVGLENKPRARHMRVAEITEMIHVHIWTSLHLTLYSELFIPMIHLLSCTLDIKPYPWRCFG